MVLVLTKLDVANHNSDTHKRLKQQCSYDGLGSMSSAVIQRYIVSRIDRSSKCIQCSPIIRNYYDF